MNNIDPIMKVRNADYLEWHNKIKQLEKENAELKSQLDNYRKIKAKDIVEILEKYFGDDKQFDNFIVTTEYKKYDIVANEIIKAL